LDGSRADRPAAQTEVREGFPEDDERDHHARPAASGRHARAHRSCDRSRRSPHHLLPRLVRGADVCSRLHFVGAGLLALAFFHQTGQESEWYRDRAEHEAAFNWSTVYALFGVLMLAIGLALDYFL
jgi:hypothetical protein